MGLQAEEAVLIADQFSTTVARPVYNKSLASDVVLTKLHIDRKTQFKAALLAKLCYILGPYKSRITL